MRKLTTIILACLIFNESHAQHSEIIRVKAGDDMIEVLAKRIYRYPVFTSGVIYFKDGNTPSALLNYNFLLGEMQFIAPKGDTLTIDNEKTINLVTIKEDSFYYDKGYLELIMAGSDVKLVMKQKINVKGTQKIGAYDQPSAVSSISSYTTFSSSPRNFKLNVRQDVLLAKETNYYFGDEFNHFFHASKKNVLNMYSKHQKSISAFLQTDPVNFYKEEDLKKLTVFLQQL